MVDNKTNATEAFLDLISGYSVRTIPEHIVHQAKRCLLDYLGVTFAGHHSQRNRLNSWAQSVASSGEISLIGSRQKCDLHTALLINGFSAHVMELDDGHRFGMLHLEAPIITALLAIAQKEHLTVENFIRGIIVGYEATVRLAEAMQPAHKQRGFHATGTCGTIGVTCAVATALKFSKDELKNAISAAATSASGLLEVIDDESQLKPYNVSHAVMSGVNAAYIGKAGFIGPNDVLGGKRGFFNVLNGEFSKSPLSVQDDAKYAIEKIYVKPYAACRHCHSAIECALNISANNDFSVEDIKAVKVETYKLAVFGHDHTSISGISSAKMSTPYGIAVALVLKKAGADAFTEQILHDEKVISLCKKVDVVENAELTAVSPGKRGAIVSIELNDGRILSNQVEYPLGEPENPISDHALEEKFDSLMFMSQVPKETIEQIKTCVWNIENSFFKLLSMI